jgi:HlyD family secretion protein
VDGVVLHRFLSNEQFVAAGTSLLEIGRLEDLEVEAEVLTLDIVAAKVGDAVEVYGPAIGQPPAQGKVARIFPAGFTKVSSLGVEQQRVKVIVRFEPAELKRLLADRRLGVGYHVRVRVYTDARADALTVPRAALFRSSRGQWQVFAVRDGRAQLVPVEVGLMSDESAEITAGLAEDEQVILAPESTLSGGARVRSK